MPVIIRHLTFCMTKRCTYTLGRQEKEGPTCGLWNCVRGNLPSCWFWQFPAKTQLFL